MSLLKSHAKRSLITLCKWLERSPRRHRDAMVTLMHEVGGVVSDYNISDGDFRGQLSYLLKQQVDWVTATELATTLDRLDDSKSMCVTFDDGTCSGYRAAIDLCEAGARCTHFIIPERCERQDANTMSWEQVRELDGLGVEIGSHSLTHPHLTRLGDHELQVEITRSKSVLEDRLGKAVTSFAYPYGEYDSRVVSAVAAGGYGCAFTTRHLYASRQSDVYRIPRFEPVRSIDQLVEIFEGQAHLFYRVLNAYYKIREATS